MNLSDKIRGHLETVLDRLVEEDEIKYYKDLTIALASNPQMVMNAEGDGWNAKTITDQADAIIAEMEK